MENTPILTHFTLGNAKTIFYKLRVAAAKYLNVYMESRQGQGTNPLFQPAIPLLYPQTCIESTSSISPSMPSMVPSMPMVPITNMFPPLTEYRQSIDNMNPMKQDYTSYIQSYRTPNNYHFQFSNNASSNISPNLTHQETKYGLSYTMPSYQYQAININKESESLMLYNNTHMAMPTPEMITNMSLTVQNHPSHQIAAFNPNHQYYYSPDSNLSQELSEEVIEAYGINYYPYALEDSSMGLSASSSQLPGFATKSNKSSRNRCKCPNCKEKNAPLDSDGKRQHICDVPGCGKMYGKTSHLRAHIRTHNGERPYSCTYPHCDKTFTRSDELQRHIRIHTGEKKYICHKCNKGFTRSDHLNKHLKTHERYDKTSCVTENDTSKNSISENTSAEIPSSSATSEEHQKLYPLTYSDERAYPCSWPCCDKRFTRRDELQRHQCAHTGEKKYENTSAEKFLSYF